MIEETIDLLGKKAKDRVTGYEGAITSVSFDLYGCVQVALSPPAKKGEQELKHGHWFDVSRLDVDTKAERVMPVPHFKAMATKPAEFGHGAAPKPQPSV